MFSKLDEVDGVLVADVSRLVRDEELGDKLMHEMKRANKKLIIARSGKIFDFSGSIERLMFKMLTWYSEEERNNIKIRQRQGIERHIEINGRWGRRPKEIDWNLYDWMRSKNMYMTEIAKELGIHYTTLKAKIKEREQYSKPINWEEYDILKAKGMYIQDIAKKLGVSTSVLKYKLENRYKEVTK